MSSLKRARESGKRQVPRHAGKSLSAPTLGLHTSDLGETRLNLQQMYALEALAQSSPAVQAARTVLHSQLVSGGLVLTRSGIALPVVEFGDRNLDGSHVPGITEDFNQHLDEHWVPFARDVVDCFIKFGVCPVVLEPLPEDTFKTAIIAKRRAHGVHVTQRKGRRSAPATVLVPHVPQLGTYEVAWCPHGDAGYTRKYVLYNNSPGHATAIDDAGYVFVRQHPDQAGNINSPLATVYEMGSFTNSLVELAFTAEIARSQPAFVTQVRKTDKVADLSAGSLFFDSESRAMQSGQEGEASEAASRALETQATLARVINQIQTRNGVDSGKQRATFSAPDVQPKLFTLPKDQELAPHVQVPQPRGDLESLIRLSMDSFSAALGVPSSLLFDGKFAGRGTQQLSLLNSTVSQLAKAVNMVLTKVYTALYGDGDTYAEAPAKLKLLTAPLAATDELVQLYSSRIVDIESVLPVALHALGATPIEVASAVERLKRREDLQRQEPAEAKPAEGKPAEGKPAEGKPS